MIDTIQLNMELEKVKKYIDILDDREKEVIVGRFGLDLKKKNAARDRKGARHFKELCVAD